VVRAEFPPAWLKKRGAVLHQRGAATFQWVWRVAAPAGSRGLRTLQGASRKTLERLYATPRQPLARRPWKLILIIGAVLVMSIIWKVPQWQAASWEGLIEPKDLAKLQNDARTTLVQAFGGAVLLIGLYFTLRNLQLTQDRQITEHYTRAVEQLGSDKLEVRLGASYALERIAMDSERDHWPIMEILAADVRMKAPWTEWRKDNLPPQLDLDVQAVLTVLGRRTRTYLKGETESLNLVRTDLRGAYLLEPHLEGAILTEAHLERAFLHGAHLENAFLMYTHLEGAILTAARLNGAILNGAHLEGARFISVNLERVNGLTVEQLARVKTLYRAHLHPPLLEMIQQQYPHLLEEGSIRKT
jgi:Pentapeptide repeats (8 copies)